MKQNIAEAEYALTQKPLLATSAERFLILNELKSSWKELPQPLRFSRILSALLSRVSVPVEEYDLIAGRCVDRELTAKEEALFQTFIRHPDHPARQIFWSSGHCTYSWEMLVEEGLAGLRAKAAEQLTTCTEDKRIFLCAMVETYDAIIAFVLRYAKAAEQIGKAEMAANLQKLAVQRPDSFVSALQLLWIVTLIDCAYISENPTLTVGRLDQLLFPFYQADLEQGLLTREQAKNYITDYYCKHNLIMGRGEHQVGDETNSTTFKRIPNFDAPQYLLLAGTDRRGELAVNELTELFAQCIVPSFKNPVVVIRYVKDMDKQAPALWRTLCDRALASSSLMFYNDRNVLSAFLRLGIPEEDARRYAHFGCNWCSPGDNAAWMASAPKSKHYHACRSSQEENALNIPYMRTNSAHSWPEDFMIVLRELAQKEPGTVSIEDFYERFFSRMAEFIDRKLAYLSHELSVRKRKPSAVITFGDCFFADSVKNAQCFSAGAKYHFELQSFQMFGTVADCFIAVDQLVMIEKKLTLRQLLDATEANFEGYAAVLAMCRNADKYGMDTPLSNRHVQRLSHTASNLVMEKNLPYLEKERLFLVPCMQSDTWHLKYGEGFGATPDGRLRGEEISKNASASVGMDKNGATALIRSVVNLIPYLYMESFCLDMMLHPSAVEGEEGLQVMHALLMTYLNNGGMSIQFNIFRPDTLIDAQRNPEKYKNLQVRVCGWNVLWNNLSKKEQDAYILRAQNIRQDG